MDDIDEILNAAEWASRFVPMEKPSDRAGREAMMEAILEGWRRQCSEPGRQDDSI